MRGAEHAARDPCSYPCLPPARAALLGPNPAPDPNPRSRQAGWTCRASSSSSSGHSRGCRPTQPQALASPRPHHSRGGRPTSRAAYGCASRTPSCRSLRSSPPPQTRPSPAALGCGALAGAFGQPSRKLPPGLPPLGGGALAALPAAQAPGLCRCCGGGGGAGRLGLALLRGRGARRSGHTSVAHEPPPLLARLGRAVLRPETRV